MSADQVVDVGIRGIAAAVWWVSVYRIWKVRAVLNGEALRRILGTTAMALLLTVLTIGPVLSVTTDLTVRFIYTMTTAMVLIIGLAFASLKPR